MECTDGSFLLYMQHSKNLLSTHAVGQSPSQHLCTLIFTSSTLPLWLPLVKLIPCFIYMAA